MGARCVWTQRKTDENNWRITHGAALQRRLSDFLLGFQLAAGLLFRQPEELGPSITTDHQLTAGEVDAEFMEPQGIQSKNDVIGKFLHDDGWYL